jgi:hypothetical protein
MGITVSVQFGEVPPLVTLETGDDELTLTEVSQFRVESTSPMVKLTTFEVSSFVLCEVIDEIVGASLTGFMVIEAEAEFEATLLAVTV